MKKLLFILLFMMIVLSACSNTGLSAHEIVNSIQIGFADGDHENQVTQNLQLPLTYQNIADVKITWQSDNLETIDIYGAVNRPLRDTTVTLAVTVEFNEQTRVKHFVVLVIGTLAKHDVTFIIDEEIFRSLVVYHGDKIEQPNLDNIDENTVLGWFEENSMLPFDFDMPVTSDLTLYLQLEVITTAQYRIKYFFQNIEDDEYTHVEDEMREGIIGESVTVYETFDGFLRAEDQNTSAIVLADGSLVIEIFYDRILFEVSFYIDDIVYELLSVKFEDSIGDAVLNPVLDEYVFIGWMTNLDNQVLYDLNSPITENIVLFAFFEAIFIYEGYYEGADGLYGNELLTFLRNTITNGYIPITYGDARYILQESDRDPNNSNNVLTIYNRWSIEATWTGIQSDSTWNREHIWPQSRLDSSASNSSRNSASDLHNLRAITPSVNSSRGNKDFDFVTTSLTYFPGDEDKGDVARVYFYMVTRYSHFSLIDYDMLSAPTRQLYSMGVLTALLQFHVEDPVDDFERNRNEVLYSYQGNRNPFIDHPEFVMRIWGDMYNHLEFFESESHTQVIVVVYHQVDVDAMRRRFYEVI